MILPPLLLLASLAVPSTAPASRPTTAPTIRTLTEVSAPIGPRAADRLTIILDTADAPDLHDWSLRAANYVLRWYPEIAARLATPGFRPPRDIRLTFRSLPDGIAFASGTNLTIGAEWVRKYPDDFGMIAHELTHIIQANRPGTPGWLTEGVADYIRYYVVEPGSRRAYFDPAKSTYSRGYQPAAGLLNWLETHRPGTIAQLQHLSRQGTYTPEKFKEIAGGDPDALWKEFVRTRTPATKPVR